MALHTPAVRREIEPKTNEVYLTGISTMNGKAVVYLSNGEVFSSDDRELQFVSKRFAIINAKKFTFCHRDAHGFSRRRNTAKITPHSIPN